MNEKGEYKKLISQRLISQNKGLIGLLFLFLVVRAISILRYHLPFWDEAVYIGMGKYIYSWGQIGLWEDIRPLVFPIVLGFFILIKIPLQYLEIVPISFSFGAIVLTYVISKRLFRKKVAFLSTLFLLITPVFYLYSYYYLTEIPSIFFALLTIYLFLKSKYFWSGIFTGIAFMTKFPQGLIFFALFVIMSSEILIFDKKKKTNNEKITKKIKANNLFIYILGFSIILFIFLIFNIMMYNNGNLITSAFHTFINARYHELNPFQTIQIIGIGGWAYNYLYYIIELIKSNYLLLFFFIGIISIIFRKNTFGTKEKEIQKYSLIILPMLFLLLYFSIIPNKQLRFSLTFLPYFCILSALGAVKLYDFFKNRIIKIFVVLLLIFLSLNAIRTDINYCAWKPQTEPAIIKELYSTLPPNKTVLTSDPVFSVYSDDKFIPYYYSAEIAIMKYDINFIYDIYLNQSDIIIFNNNSLLCIEKDIYCKNSIEKIKAKINKNKLVREYDYGSDTYYIYETIKY
ncbi:MAG: glycosyltransferase family 39 protein [Candidatus Woesearchaeota archaeon]